MRFMISTLALGLLFSAAITNEAKSQHLHQHGGHVDVHQNVVHGHDTAGHLIDGSGHHITPHGNHSGSTGFYENGSHSHGGIIHQTYPYVQSGIASPIYIPSNNIITPNVSYPTPSVVSTPPVSTTIVANKIPTPGVSQSGLLGTSTAGAIELRNPKTSGGPITYSLNSFNYTINPGQVQTVSADREWIIKFNNGIGRVIAYRLVSGKYEFAVSPEAGWDVARSTEDETAMIAPSLPRNELPSNPIPPSLGLTAPPDTVAVPGN